MNNNADKEIEYLNKAIEFANKQNEKKLIQNKLEKASR